MSKEEGTSIQGPSIQGTSIQSPSKTRRLSDLLAQDPDTKLAKDDPNRYTLCKVRRSFPSVPTSYLDLGPITPRKIKSYTEARNVSYEHLNDTLTGMIVSTHNQATKIVQRQQIIPKQGNSTLPMSSLRVREAHKQALKLIGGVSPRRKPSYLDFSTSTHYPEDVKWRITKNKIAPPDARLYPNLPFNNIANRLITGKTIGEVHHFFPFHNFSLHVEHYKTDMSIFSIRRIHFTRAEFEDFWVEKEISVFYYYYRMLYSFAFASIMTFSFACHYHMNRIDYYYLYFGNWTMTLGCVYAIAYEIYILVMEHYKPTPNNGLRYSMQSSELDVRYFYPHRLQPGYSKDDPNDDEPVPDLPLELQSFVPWRLHFVESIIWLLHILALPCSILSMLLYWSFLFEKSKKGWNCLAIDDAYVYGLNIFFLIVDMFVVALPVHWSHIFLSIIFWIFYREFARLYHGFVGKYPFNENGERPYIDSITNYEDHVYISAFLVPIAGICFLLIIQVLVIFIYSLRLRIVYRWKSDVYAEHLYDYTDGEDRTPRRPRIRKIIPRPSLHSIFSAV